VLHVYRLILEIYTFLITAKVEKPIIEIGPMQKYAYFLHSEFSFLASAA